VFENRVLKKSLKLRRKKQEEVRENMMGKYDANGILECSRSTCEDNIKKELIGWETHKRIE
jgi:hypothetical protein